jgi:hypothetical protein
MLILNLLLEVAGDEGAGGLLRVLNSLRTYRDGNGVATVVVAVMACVPVGN